MQFAVLLPWLYTRLSGAISLAIALPILLLLNIIYWRTRSASGRTLRGPRPERSQPADRTRRPT